MILFADELSRGNGSYRLDVQHVTVLLQRAHTNQKGRSKKTFQEEGGTFLVAIVRDGYSTIQRHHENRRWRGRCPPMMRDVVFTAVSLPRARLRDGSSAGTTLVALH